MSPTPTALDTPNAHDAPTTSQTLPLARAAFVDAIRRDTPGTDLPRFVKVLDALIAWSVARADQLAFKADASRPDVLSFTRAGSGGVVWSVQAVRGAGPKLELYPPAGRPLRAADRAHTLETLNAHVRPPLQDGDRLRIGFGALKNDAARGAVLALLKQLLAAPSQPAASAPAESGKETLSAGVA